MTQTALVTGGAGFLGSHLCHRLSTEGWKVAATSRSPQAPTDETVRFYVSDLSDFDATQRLLGEVQPDVVFHLAGSVGAAPDAALVLPTIHSHVISTLNLLTLAVDGAIERIVLTGSLLEPVDSLKDATPSSPYAAAKWVSSIYARMFHKLYQSPVVIVRPFMAYGPLQHETKVLPYVIRCLARGHVPKLGSGDWRADWIYVSDVIEGFMLAAQTAGIDGSDIDLGCGELESIRNVITRTVAMMNTTIIPEFSARADRPDAPERVANIAKAKEILGFAPSVELDEGLRRTVDWYRERA